MGTVWPGQGDEKEEKVGVEKEENK